MTKTTRTTVADQIKAISPAVEDRVLEAAVLFAREVTRRADMIVAGLDQLKKLETEGYKIAKGSVVTFNADGSEASLTYTKEQLEEIKKNDEKVKKLTGALDKAIGKGDVGDLSNLVK
jgi:hypothetical protein